MKKMKRVLRVGICFILAFTMLFAGAPANTSKADDKEKEKGKKSTINVYINEKTPEQLPAANAELKSLTLYRTWPKYKTIELSGTASKDGKISFDVDGPDYLFLSAEVIYGGETYSIGLNPHRVRQKNNDIQIWVDPLPTLMVIFKPLKGKPIIKNVRYGTKLTSEIVPPLTAETEEFSYSWNNNPIDVVVKTNLAFCEIQTRKEYKVTFIKADGSSSYIKVPYGDTIKAEKVPELAIVSDEFSYSWDTNPVDVKVTTDLTFTEQQIRKEYKVTFIKADGSNSYIKVPYGNTISSEKVPALTEETKEFSYSWDTNPVDVKVTTDLTFTEQQTRKQYKVTFIKLNGKETSIIVPYGNAIKDTDVPALEANSAEFTYSWDSNPVGKIVTDILIFKETKTAIVVPTATPEEQKPSTPPSTPPTKPEESQTPVASPEVTAKPSEKPIVTDIPDDETPADDPDSDEEEDVDDTDDEDTEATPTATPKTLPKTGTTSPEYFYIIGLGMIGIGLVVIKIRKKNQV